MKKVTGFLFLGFMCFAAALGSFKAAFDHDNYIKTKADNIVIQVDEEGYCEFGVYPQSLAMNVSIEDIQINGTSDTKRGGGYLDYNDKQYFIDFANIDMTIPAKMNNGLDTSEVNNKVQAFNVEPVRWKRHKINNDTGDYLLVASSILDSKIFAQSAYDYLDSDIRIYLIGLMFNSLFTSQEQEALSYIALDDINSTLMDRIAIPSISQLKDDFASFDFRPTDLTICRGISTNFSPFNYSPIWSRTTANKDLKTIYIRHNLQGEKEASINEEHIGVLPMISINKSFFSDQQGGGDNPGGGGGTSLPPVNYTGNTAMIIIGFIFVAGGIVFIIITFTKWGKNMKLPGFKVKWQYFLVLGISFVVTVVGCNLFAYGTVVKINLTIFAPTINLVGYYRANDNDCLGFGERMVMGLTSNHEVYRYLGDAWSDQNPSGSRILYTPQAGIGSWRYENGKLIITCAAEWKRSSWENIETTYIGANGAGSFITYEGYEGASYQWSHSNNDEPVYEQFTWF